MNTFFFDLPLRRRIVTGFLVLAFARIAPCLESIDEDELFGDTATVIESAPFTSGTTVTDERSEKTLTVGGSIAADATGSLGRTWFDNQSADRTSFGASIVGAFHGDIRLPNSVKALVAAEVQARNAHDTVQFYLRELFLDFNLGYRAYFRAGKQVLQWGRCFFFNPVDLVNVEKKPFLDQLSGREGAFGLKTHVPFGTTFNLYSFVGMQNVRRADSLAFSLKAEALLGGTEIALSTWLRRKSDPVYGFELSSGLGDFSLTAEAALYTSLSRFNLDKSSFFGPSPNGIVIDTLSWVPRVALGIGRSFDAGDVNDRIMVTLEGYYNHAGVTMPDLDKFLPPGYDPNASNQNDMALLTDQLSLLEVNNLSKWYAALFCSVSRFILYDMTLSANMLYNFNQRSAIAQAALTYTTLHNLSFSLLLSGYPGPDYTEYTLWGSGLSVGVRSSIRF